MAGEPRIRTGEAWRSNAVPFYGFWADAPAFDTASHEHPMERTAVAPQELVGAMFTTPKDLRHLAEQQFGEDFVPTRVLAESAHFGVFSLDAGGMGQVVVHAERERHWYPFRVTRVESSGGDGRSPGA